ncbi:uncharacterized protein VICG_01840 [Vittaforma corneae ATCC 50505]|uniref:Uncharacterized protein n=1 Tax=Vittaforma corneae (strain ATCC 50505) TaxID=993615 RepID=L2GJX4_VITCO|nr:uncharacterized protein VICG_01840 [Vittaforma corneae ATCC 50505]ELA41141.1 hypothetical protein VICG_01840 [Vittaforma corneae ATCC 50505]
MKKYKNVSRSWRLKKYPVVEIITHITFYAVRFILFLITRAFYFNLKIVTPSAKSAANNYMVNYTFSLFLLYFVLYCIFTENIYGYCLAVVVMFHNFVLMVAIVITTHIDDRTKDNYWILSLVISSTYIFELCISIFFIRKSRTESNRALFQKIGADQKINDMYSTRQKLRTLSTINIFIPIITVQKLYLAPTQFGLKSETSTAVILLLTVIQHLFVYANFHQESLVQRIIAVAITIIKAGLSLNLIILTAIKYAYLLNKANDARIIVYLDLLLITLVFLYYLWKDMRNFGKGLQKHILFRTRELTL